jgi:methylamine--corrinoid protein Co-methyltransferase
MAEVGEAVSRQQLDLVEANALVKKLLGKYEHVFIQPGGNPGEPFQQAYDVDNLQPKPVWFSMYEQVRQDVKALGLRI